MLPRSSTEQLYKKIKYLSMTEYYDLIQRELDQFIGKKRGNKGKPTTEINKSIMFKKRISIEKLEVLPRLF